MKTVINNVCIPFWYICRMRKYPIGKQDFKSIIEDGFMYVDKTKQIHKLIDTGNYYFLSRPRRFGKSLLLSTINEIFSGRKELFKGLWIEENWNWEKTNPVIYLKMSQIDYQTLGLYAALAKELDLIAANFGLVLLELEMKDKFRELIRKASANGKVVILIDEYDKPIIDYLDNISQAEENRDTFKLFYSVLKDADEYIRLLLITGVSRFSKISIFSDLNNLEDISLGKNFNDLIGITQSELEENFDAELIHLTEDMNMDKRAILQEVKKWYNGYSWGGEETLYNPFSVLSLMKQKQFRNFWFATGSPSFLIKQICKKEEYQFDNIYLNENSLGNFDIANISSAPLLFQTGYLTIKEYDHSTRSYRLGYPNQEVEDSLLDNLLSAYRGVFPNDSAAVTGELLKAFLVNDIPKAIDGLNAIIATIPYDHGRADTESIFHIITHLTFKKIGVDVESEVHSAKGRCDVLIKTSKYIYVIELKLDTPAFEAIQQIINKRYFQPYAADKRKKIALGISFSSKERMVTDYIAKDL